VPVYGGQIRVRVVVPASQGKTLPMIVYFHGGGACKNIVTSTPIPQITCRVLGRLH
jgi:acetyl esterase/lipase